MISHYMFLEHSLCPKYCARIGNSGELEAALALFGGLVGAGDQFPPRVSIYWVPRGAVLGELGG